MPGFPHGYPITLSLGEPRRLPQHQGAPRALQPDPLPPAPDRPSTRFPPFLLRMPLHCRSHTCLVRFLFTLVVHRTAKTLPLPTPPRRLPPSIKAPHERSGLTPLQYSLWLDSHPPEEVLRSVGAALAAAGPGAEGLEGEARDALGVMRKLCAPGSG